MTVEPMFGIPSPVAEFAERQLSDVPIVASLRIGVTRDTLVEFCDRASVDWTVTEGAEEPYERPQPGTAQFVLYGEHGERFAQLMPGQIVEFSLIQGGITMRVCSHRITQIDRRLSWRTFDGVRSPLVTVTLLTAGPLERFARVKVSAGKKGVDDWQEERDDVRAARLLKLVDLIVPDPTFTFTAKPSDPALAVVADPSMLSFNAAGQPRHWGDETDDLTNAWSIVASTVTNTKAERRAVANGAAIRSYRPHMVNGPTVKGSIYVTGQAQIKVGVLWGATAEACYKSPTLVEESAWSQLTGTDQRHDFTLTVPAAARWVRLQCQFRNVVGTLGVERFWASTDPVAVGRVTLRNLPDADIENKAAGVILDSLADNAHAAFYETRLGYLTYMTFDRLNALGQFTQPVQAVLGCRDVLSDAQSTMQSYDRVNVLRVAFFDKAANKDRTLVVTDDASAHLMGIYDRTLGGDLVVASGSPTAAGAGPKVLASDLMSNIGAATLNTATDEYHATGKATEPRERVNRLTTVPFHMLQPYQVKELMQLAPMACVRVDDAPAGFPQSKIGQWVGAVLGTTLTGTSSRRTQVSGPVKPGNMIPPGYMTDGSRWVWAGYGYDNVQPPVTVQSGGVRLAYNLGADGVPVLGGVWVDLVAGNRYRLRVTAMSGGGAAAAWRATVGWYFSGPMVTPDGTSQTSEVEFVAPVTRTYLVGLESSPDHSSAAHFVTGVEVAHISGAVTWESTVNVSMTMNVLDMTRVSEAPAVVVSADRSSAPLGGRVSLSFKPAVEGEDAPIGTTYQWQFLRGGETVWNPYASGANPLIWSPATVGPMQWRVVGTTPDGDTFQSEPVLVTVTAIAHTERVTVTAPDGYILGQSAAMAAVVDADSAVSGYEWWYLRPGSSTWAKWSQTAAAVDWAASEAGVWQWKAVAVHTDGFRVESAPERVWVGRSFVATVSTPSAVVGASVTVTATIDPTDHGATVVGWEQQTGTGPWYSVGSKVNPLPVKAVLGATRYRLALEFPDGTDLYSTVATVTGTAPVTPPPVTPPPDPKPEIRKVTIKATSSRSFVASGGLRYANAYDRCYHGYYDATNGQQKSCVVFAIPNEVRNANRILGARLRVTRIASIGSSTGNLKVGVHGSASPTSTWGAITGKQEALQSVAGPGYSTSNVTKWLTLTSAVYSKFKGTSVKGLLLGPSGSDYMALFGVGGAGGAATVGSSVQPVLEVEYEVLV